MQHASSADSLRPRPPGFVISNHFKASWSPLIHPRMSSRSRTFFILECARYGIVCVVLQGTLWGSESNANRSGRHSLLSWYNNGEPERGQMQQQHARASSLLLRPRWRGSSRPWWKILARRAPLPCHLATCRLGKPLSGAIWTISSLQFWCWAAHCCQSRQQEEAIWSSFRAAEGQSRGSAFKGPEARYRLKVLWSATDGSNDMPEAGAIHQEITSSRFPSTVIPVQEQCSPTAGFCSSHLSHNFA